MSASACACSVIFSSDSIASSSSPAVRASLTHAASFRPSRECVSGGGPGGRARTNVPWPVQRLDQAFAL